MAEDVTPAPAPTDGQPSEKDIMALKGKVEKAEKQLHDAQETHRAETTSAATKYNESREELLRAEARITGLEEKLGESASSATELADVKLKLETAEKGKEELITQALEFRKAMIVATYNIPLDTVKDKTLTELDNYEEALKAVTARGVGNYALGGGGGVSDLAGKSPMELARMAYDKSK